MQMIQKSQDSLASSLAKKASNYRYGC